LAQNSAVKCENLHTLPLNLIVRTIGRMPNSLMQLVDDALRVSLALK
jgi:mRNA-degrading endonuclease toxin of MazEF toxin-antitoxin module